MIVTSHDGVELHCRVDGPATAPLVLFLHGATLDSRSWQRQMQALSDRYRVVAPDLRGHGDSTLDKPFTYDDAVRDVAALRAHFGNPVAVLVGLSLGGNIAQSVLHRDPTGIAGAVLADCACNTAPRRPGNRLLTALSLASLRVYPRSTFLRQVAKRTAVSAAVRAYVHETSSRLSTSRIVEVMDALVRGAIRPDPTWQVPVPTLLLCGTEDKLATIRKELSAWADRDPGCQFTLIPQAGHASNQDNPEVFTSFLLEHLERVLPTSTT